MKNKRVVVYVGYDDRETDAYVVCKNSLLEQSAQAGHYNIDVVPLKHKDLRAKVGFNRPWKIKPDGSYEDIREGRPFSTQFAFTRFLTPILYADLLKNSPRREMFGDLCVFVDCDFLFKADINDLINEIYKDKEYSERVMWCVQHDFNPKQDTKMDNCSQWGYNRKLWSALMVFNARKFIEDPEILTVEDVNSTSGMCLHLFDWLDNTEIGSIPEGWQFIPNHSEDRVLRKDIKAIHYTRGVPTMGINEGEYYSDAYYEVLRQSKWSDFII